MCNNTDKDISDRIIKIISSITAIVGMFTAVISIYYLSMTLQDQIESRKPIIDVKTILQKVQSESDITIAYQFTFTFDDIGIRPAYNLKGNFIVLDGSISEEPVRIDSFDIPGFSEIMPGMKPQYVVYLPKTFSFPVYILLFYNYQDTFSHKSFSHYRIIKIQSDDAIKPGNPMPQPRSQEVDSIMKNKIAKKYFQQYHLIEN